MIKYDEIIKTSLLEVVRESLRLTAKNGLPVEGNHFYISFATDKSGVIIPAFLKEKYPKEMTIVLQNSFSNLKVEEGSLDSTCFSVDLKFSGIVSTVKVPFKAIKSFYDPFANFALQFDFKLTSNKDETEPNEPKTSNESPKKQEENASNGKIIDFNSFKKK
ncbi:MAG: Stringent starvation protein B [Alphaproteobacteria bacterium ADurb.Bin438]|nr:MAG: Stringent starvation protein B [Alphaproteobacteria bacterium ADurb.Bin438]